MDQGQHRSPGACSPLSHYPALRATPLSLVYPLLPSPLLTTAANVCDKLGKAGILRLQQGETTRTRSLLSYSSSCKLCILVFNHGMGGDPYRTDYCRRGVRWVYCAIYRTSAELTYQLGYQSLSTLSVFKPQGAIPLVFILSLQQQLILPA